MEEGPPLTNGVMEESPPGSESPPPLRIRDPDRPRVSQLLSTASGSTAVTFSEATVDPYSQDTTNRAGPDNVTDANLNHHLEAQATAAAIAATVDMITFSDHVHTRSAVAGRPGSYSASGLTTLVNRSVDNSYYRDDDDGHNCGHHDEDNDDDDDVLMMAPTNRNSAGGQAGPYNNAQATVQHNQAAGANHNDNNHQNNDAHEGAQQRRGRPRRRHRPRNRGRQHEQTDGEPGPSTGQNHQGANPRAANWPSNAAMRADPRRWDNDRSEQAPSSGWSNNDWPGQDTGAVESAAEGGVVVSNDNENGLADWTGGIGPAPDVWDGRAPFADPRHGEVIADWVYGPAEPETETTLPDEDVLADIDDTNNGGTLVPPYWTPLTIGDQVPHQYFAELLLWEPPLLEVEDLTMMPPFWKMVQSSTSNLLKPYTHRLVKGPSPEETDAERSLREADEGSDWQCGRLALLKVAIEEKKREEKKRGKKKAAQLEGLDLQGPEKIPTGVRIIIRGARLSDLKDILAILNYHIEHNACVPALQPLSDAAMSKIFHSNRKNKLPFLVAVVPGKKIVGKGKQRNQDPIILPDEILGFAYADLYHDDQGNHRSAAEVEVYTHNRHYMKGIASCLMDKMLGLLDPHFQERGGYQIEGDEAHGIGARRVVSSIIVQPVSDDEEVRAWKHRWFVRGLGFESVGLLEDMGTKHGKTVSMAIFKRATGAAVNDTVQPTA